MSKTIVTLTTIPSRLTESYGDDFRSCIKSLLDQSVTDYELNMNIPYFLKTTGEEYILPESLIKLESETENFTIFRTEDYGPGTKLIPTVERSTDPEDIIIVVDDDLVYHHDLVMVQRENQTKWLESIVGYDGLRSKDNLFGDVRDYFFSSNYRTSRVDILQHYKSVSYKRRYFDDDFIQFTKDYFSWSDDLMIAAYFSMKRRERIATFHESDRNFVSLEEWQLYGGVFSFPVLRHTQHDSLEGCNQFRHLSIDDNSGELFKFIDHGYDPKPEV
jgi:hypothetical protein